MSDWIIFILGLIVGFWLKAWFHELTIHLAIKYIKIPDSLRDDENLKKRKSDYKQKIKEMKDE